MNIRTVACTMLLLIDEEDTMHILSMLFIGLLAGALAKAFHPGKDPGGLITTLLLGVAGSFLAGFIGHALGWYRTPGSGPGLLMSTLGAFILLVIYSAVIRSRSHHRPGAPGPA
jgi:uncharacterized membrane protein YeaQ/YmgE (transglycosylase-associated protein family)